jgi:hypothetical protein
MHESSHIMTMEEALDCIRQQFVEPGGLLARIEMGEKVEISQVEMMGTAFKVIQLEWKDKEIIPKEQVRLVRFASDSIPYLDISNCIHDAKMRLKEYCLTCMNG